ncbi:hypothetical protein NPIL_141741 [Nephila pilipes]|uniref:Uncharacterized protein n=1 Tax=Nephila pilipes TaxID=299642 RepID=A0A8X6MCR3_NEPPI|nr:hypothetical protein NPIL_141741 [Nephila pilipes]
MGVPCRGVRVVLHLEYNEAVANFRFATAYDYLQAHFQRISLVPDKTYSLCRTFHMDGDHLRNFPEFDNLPAGIPNCYWKAGLPMLNSHRWAQAE